MSENNDTKSTEAQANRPADAGAEAQAEAQTEVQGAAGADAGAAAASSSGETGGAPAGTTTPGALFDMAPKPKTEPKAAGQKPASGAKTAQTTSPTKYPEGYEIRYGREKFKLPKEMTAQEALAWLAEDDFPELKYEREAKVVHDKDKDRLVVTREAQKKGLIGDLRA